MADLEVDALGYLSPDDVRKQYSDSPFGPDRLLTVFEEADMMLCSLTRKEIADMTPSELQKRADSIADQTTLLIGA